MAKRSPAKKLKGIEVGALVEVTWGDAYACLEGWVDISQDDVFSGTTVQSVGYLIGVENGHVALAASWQADTTNVGRVGVVPTSWIQRVRVL
jgi:hypothetical protein